MRSTGVTFDFVDLSKQVEEHYRNTDRILETLYPWVLVRPLDRAQEKNGIILPGKQNKTTLESVVLATWKPFWEKVYERESGKSYDVLNETDVKPGDHVIHPHHVGLPDAYLNDQNYRLVREEDLQGVLHYHSKDWLYTQLLSELIDEGGTTNDAKQVAVRLLEKFDIVPKYGYHSKTTSGK